MCVLLGKNGFFNLENQLLNLKKMETKDLSSLNGKILHCIFGQAKPNSTSTSRLLRDSRFSP